MLDEAQRTTLAAHIRANTDQAVVDALGVRNDTKLAELYNEDSLFIVWREAINPDEYREVMIWTDVDQMTSGKARIWEWITEQMTRPVDATKANIRAGVNEAFNAAGTAAFLAIAKEACSLVESIYATGEGTDANPGIRVFVGVVSDDEVSNALNENP